MNLIIAIVSFWAAIYAVATDQCSVVPLFAVIFIANLFLVTGKNR